MRVILDTNVLLSALMSPGGTSDAIYAAAVDGHFQLLAAEAQLDETRRVSRYPRLRPFLTAHRVGLLVNFLRRDLLPEPLAVLPDRLEIADPDDVFLLRMAITGDADWLVTGDKRAGLLQLGSVGRTRIPTPTVFLESFGPA